MAKRTDRAGALAGDGVCVEMWRRCLACTQPAIVDRQQDAVRQVTLRGAGAARFPCWTDDQTLAKEMLIYGIIV